MWRSRKHLLPGGFGPLKISALPAGEVPGVRWPDPDPADKAGSMIVKPPPGRCVNCGKCPTCGR